MRPSSSPSEEHLPEEKRTTSMFQASSLEEAEKICQRSLIPSSDTNTQRRLIISTKNGVMENNPRKL